MAAESVLCPDPPLSAGSIDGGWLIETQWLPDESTGLAHVTTLYAVVPRHCGAGGYRVSGRGFLDPLHYGDRLDMAFDAGSVVSVPAAWDDTRPLDRGDSFWLPLSRCRGPAAQADDARKWLQARFAGIRIEVRPFAAAAPWPAPASQVRSPSPGQEDGD